VDTRGSLASGEEARGSRADGVEAANAMAGDSNGAMAVDSLSGKDVMHECIGED
jgi:hypothetical protein